MARRRRRKNRKGNACLTQNKNCVEVSLYGRTDTERSRLIEQITAGDELDS